MERSCGKNPKRRTELAYSRLHFAVVAYYQSLCYHHATYLECFILLAVILYLCVTWYNQGRVVFFFQWNYQRNRENKCIMCVAMVKSGEKILIKRCFFRLPLL